MTITGLPLINTIKTLESARLLLRVDTERDYVEAFATLDNAAIKERFGIVDDAALEVQRGKIAGGFTTYRTAVMFFHFTLKESGKVIGSCSFHNWYPIHRRSEIGYALTDEGCKNKGYMKEALPLILKYGFEVMQLNRVEAIIGPNNVASQRLALGAGFVQEALLREHYCSEGVIGDSLVFRRLVPALVEKS